MSTPHRLEAHMERATFTTGHDTYGPGMLQFLQITAPGSQVQVIAGPEKETPTLEICGPAEAVRGAEVERISSIWRLRLTATDPEAEEPVAITAHVPREIQVDSTTGSGGLTVSGVVRGVAADTTSGHVYVADTTRASVSTTSGNITVSHATTKVEVKTTSGDIDVRGGSEVMLHTSGNARFKSTRDCQLFARVGGSTDFVLGHQGHQVEVFA